jgi:hypothetical protein
MIFNSKMMRKIKKDDGRQSLVIGWFTFMNNNCSSSMFFGQKILRQVVFKDGGGGRGRSLPVLIKHSDAL